ncbi:helix-turn-helix domain-containing protein [Egibacter rhizosphaerae]|uniref:Helix-turn-helix domain-containing protein n=1 Tax=Egibacter rhizosphaerae TaxID=1670831 RepID=A0A411YG01_9ACTN|nr:helix-turn-helix domain-containing protein [Egibacter rhizosphaerae]QBI20022.1 helix-turn-helix domain-containing protein [Egibacter rhizosphaerae]
MSYREWAPGERLREHVLCAWARHFPDGSDAGAAVVPDACMDVVWTGRTLLVAGPDTRPAPVVAGPGSGFVGLRFRTGRAPDVLGVPSSVLRDRRVPAADVWGAPAQRLTQRLGEAGTAVAQVQLIEAFVAARLDRDATSARGSVDAALTQGLVGELLRAPQRRVGELAGDLGVGERRLRRHCEAAVGYGPKTLQRVVRFRRFLHLAERCPGAGLAELALAAGYADQAHLTREARALGGAAPTVLVGSPDPVVASPVSESFKTGAWTPGQPAGHG